MHSRTAIGPAIRHPEKSTSGGVLALGDHVLKSWSKNQTIVALSSGEAELYAINTAASGAIGLQSLLHDMGIDLEIQLITDSSAAKAMLSRTGLGKMRHLMTNALWLQEKIRNKEITVVKIKNTFNISDMMTKAHDARFMRYLVELMDHAYEEGRSEVAPHLDHLAGGLHLELLLTLGIPDSNA